MFGTTDTNNLESSEMSSGNQTVNVTEVFLSSSRLTEKKLEGIQNYQQWRKLVKFALLSREQDHLTTFKSTDETRKPVDCWIFYQMMNSMDG